MGATVTVPPGMRTCTECGRSDVYHHDGRIIVHFPDATSSRPCRGSWPSAATNASAVKKATPQ